MRMFESATLCARATEPIAKIHKTAAAADERIFTRLERKYSQAFKENRIFLPDKTRKADFAMPRLQQSCRECMEWWARGKTTGFSIFHIRFFIFHLLNDDFPERAARQSSAPGE